MQKDSLDIGVKGFGVSVTIDVPESDADVLKLSPSEAYRVACFARAHRINKQERSGAREHVRKSIAGKDAGLLKRDDFRAQLASECQAIVDKYNGEASTRTRIVTAPATLVVPKGKKTFSAAEVAELAKQAGITLEVVE